MSTIRYDERNSHNNNAPNFHRSQNDERSSSKFSRHHSNGLSSSVSNTKMVVSSDSTVYAKHKHDNYFYDKGGAQKEEKLIDQEKVKLRRVGDWSEQLSKAGKKYFYNCKTEVSQWEKPQEWIDYEQKYSSPEKHKKAVVEDIKSSDSYHSASAKPCSSNEYTYVEDRISTNNRSSRFAKSERTCYKSANKVNPHHEIGRHSVLDDVNDKSYSGQRQEQHVNNSSSDRSYQSDQSAENVRAKREHSPERQSSQDDKLAKKRKFNEKDGFKEDLRVEKTDEEESTNLMRSTSDVDLDRLPRLLVEIAERHNIDLADSNALDKIKQHLKAALSIEANNTQMDSNQLPNAVSGDSKTVQLSDINTDMQAQFDAAEDTNQLAEVEAPLPVLSEPHKLFYNETLTSHIRNWSAIHFENQADHLFDRSFHISLDVAQMSSDLKCARSLVRTAEIRSTLLEQRVSYLRQQYHQLDSNNTSSKLVLSSNSCLS